MFYDIEKKKTNKLKGISNFFINDYFFYDKKV